MSSSSRSNAARSRRRRVGCRRGSPPDPSRPPTASTSAEHRRVWNFFSSRARTSPARPCCCCRRSLRLVRTVVPTSCPSSRSCATGSPRRWLVVRGREGPISSANLRLFALQFLLVLLPGLVEFPPGLVQPVEGVVHLLDRGSPFSRASRAWAIADAGGVPGPGLGAVPRQSLGQSRASASSFPGPGRVWPVLPAELGSSISGRPRSSSESRSWSWIRLVQSGRRPGSSSPSGRRPVPSARPAVQQSLGFAAAAFCSAARLVWFWRVSWPLAVVP